MVNVMSEDIKVSIVVPIYNVEKYLDRCIKSILNQTYKNIEIILVDDGSADESGAIADRYADTDDRIRVIHKANGGLSDARNAGIDICGGEYICFVDSDDAIDSRYVSCMLEACQKNDADIAICRFENVEADYTVHEGNITVAEEVMTSIEALQSIYSANNVNTVVAWNKLYSAKLWKDVRYPKGRIHEDEATTYKLLHKAKKVVSLDTVLYYYYRNASGITGSTFSHKRLDILWAIEQRMEYFKNNGLMDLYEKDSYKYLCKLLTCYYQVKHMSGDNKQLTDEMMCKYKKKLQECLDSSFAWSTKRKLAMRIFSYFPMMYAVITGKR